MRQLLVTCWMVGLVSTSFAQEDRLPLKAAQRYAKALTDQAAAARDVPITPTVDVLKPCAVQGEGGGAMIVPDRKVSKATLSKLDKDVIPLGQLWFRKWTLVVDGKALTKKQLRVVTANVDGKDRPFALFVLGLRKKATDVDLVIFTKGNKPVQTIKLTKVEYVQELPVVLEWRRGEKDADHLVLTVLGKHETKLRIARQ